jgi:hypothetical protein
VDALNINIDGTATFSSSVTATNFYQHMVQGKITFYLEILLIWVQIHFPLSIAAPAELVYGLLV